MEYEQSPGKAGGLKDVSRPGRLGCWPLTSGNRSHLKVASRVHQVHLIQPLVLYLLMTDVLANDRFVPPHRRDEVPSRPQVLTNEVPLLPHEGSSDMNRALPFDVPNGLRHRVLRRNRDQHVHVVSHQVPFLNSAFPLLRKRSKYRPEVPSKFSLEHLSSALLVKDNMVLAIPPRVAEALVVVHTAAPLRVALVGSRRGVCLGATPGNVKL